MTALATTDGMEVVPIETGRSLPLRVTVRRDDHVIEVVVLASVADVPALRLADPGARPARAALSTPTTGLPLVRTGRADILGVAAPSLLADRILVSVVVRAHGRVVWSRAVAQGQVHALTVDGAWLADLYVLALDLPLGALSGASPVGDGLRLALRWSAAGRLDVAPPRPSSLVEGAFDALT